MSCPGLLTSIQFSHGLRSVPGGLLRFAPPIPAVLPRTCPNCGAPLHWTPVTIFDPVIGLEKVDHYKAECACGEVHYRDGRGQEVEPAVPNLPPDTSEFANSPQGPQAYSGYMELVKQ